MARRKSNTAVKEAPENLPEEEEIVEMEDELVELEDADDEEIGEGEGGEGGDFSAKDLATACGTDARSIRKFLRSHLPKTAHPGQGGRYAFTAEEVETLKGAFAAKPAKVAKAAPATDETVEDDDVTDLEFEDPSDEDLDEIESGDEVIADELEDLDLES